MANQNKRPANLPNEFAEEAMELVANLIPTTALSFYFLDPHMHLKGFVGINVDDTINSEYDAEYWQLDPLHPRNFANSQELLVCSNTTMPHKQWRQTVFYQDFMKPRGLTHSADLFFRNDTGIIAALLTTRTDVQGEYLPDELDLLRSAQRFIQFSLNKIYLPPRVAEREYVEQQYGLTQRELDVLESAMAGHSNKVMCEELKMRLPTLRTHLHHIFEKVGVSGTNELISRIFRELSDRDHRMEVE